MKPLRAMIEAAIIDWLERVHDCDVDRAQGLWHLERLAVASIDEEVWIWYHHPSGGQELVRYQGTLDKLLFEVVGLLA